MEQNRKAESPTGLAKCARQPIFTPAATPDAKTVRGMRPGQTLLLHLRPATVPIDTLKFSHTFGLGGMCLVLILLLIGSGLLMMFAYEPTPRGAYSSIITMQREILFGRLVRGVHYWSSNLLIAMAVLHLLRVFLTGAYRPPRRSNWLIGLGLLFLILASGFTGYLLPWDQTSYWAVTICSEMLRQIPGLGPALQNALLGGPEVGAPTMINFYAFHTTVVPVLLAALTAWHFWHVRRAGGVVRPSGNESNTTQQRASYRSDLLFREAAVAAILIAVVLLLAIGFGAPLAEPANPGLSPNPAKAPWYFLGFQELLIHFHPLFAVCIIPAVFALALVGAAYLPDDGPTPGTWFLSRRGRLTAAAGAFTALFLAAAWILADEFLVGPDGWIAGAPGVIGNGLVPFGALLALLVGFHYAMNVFLKASGSETVQALFVLLLTGLAALTATGAWFRGLGLALVMP